MAHRPSWQSWQIPAKQSKILAKTSKILANLAKQAKFWQKMNFARICQNLLGICQTIKKKKKRKKEKKKIFVVVVVVNANACMSRPGLDRSTRRRNYKNCRNTEHGTFQQ